MGVKKTAVNFGFVILALSLAQFIMTVDTTIMNVSIPTLVNDLKTEVGLVQAAITLYALVMASLMLVGGKLGELYGRKKMFRLGLVIYGTGSLVTSLSPNIWVLMFGWSLLEGIGASLMMPAMMSLIAINFSGKKRVSALGITAAVAGAAAALGPIIGGTLATYASWRYAFGGEVVIAIITFVMAVNIPDTARLSKEKMDFAGAITAIFGMGFFVLGVLQAKDYGWIKAIKPFTIGGIKVNLFGLSIVPLISGIGVFLIWRLLKYESGRQSKSLPVLLKANLLKIIPLRSGLSVVLITQLVLGGFMFTMPLFLQLVLGYSAMKAGLALLPLSLFLIVASIFGKKLADKRGMIDTIRIGQMLIVAGLVILIVIISNQTTVASMMLPFAIVGIGIGIVLPLIQTIIVGSVGNNDSSQASGLNYTYQQLGMSLGTAVIGSVLLFSLGNNLIKGLSGSANFDQSVIQANSVKISSNVEFVDNATLEKSLKNSDLSPAQQESILQINSDSRIDALRVSIGVAVAIGLLGIGASGRTKDYYQTNPT